MNEEKFKLYQEISDELSVELKDHINRFEQHELDEIERFDKLIDAQQKNTDAISELTESVASVVKGTSSIIQLHKDFQGAARVGSGVQGFMIWVLKWGAIGAGIVAGMNWAIEHFTK